MEGTVEIEMLSIRCRFNHTSLVPIQMVELLLSMWKAKQPKELIVNAPAFVKALARCRLSAMVTMRMLVLVRSMMTKC